MDCFNSSSFTFSARDYLQLPQSRWSQKSSFRQRSNGTLRNPLGNNPYLPIYDIFTNSKVFLSEDLPPIREGSSQFTNDDTGRSTTATSTKVEPPRTPRPSNSIEFALSPLPPLPSSQPSISPTALSASSGSYATPPESLASPIRPPPIALLPTYPTTLVRSAPIARTFFDHPSYSTPNLGSRTAELPHLPATTFSTKDRQSIHLAHPPRTPGDRRRSEIVITGADLMALHGGSLSTTPGTSPYSNLEKEKKNAADDGFPLPRQEEEIATDMVGEERASRFHDSLLPRPLNVVARANTTNEHSYRGGNRLPPPPLQLVRANTTAGTGVRGGDGDGGGSVRGNGGGNGGGNRGHVRKASDATDGTDGVVEGFGLIYGEPAPSAREREREEGGGMF